MKIPLQIRDSHGGLKPWMQYRIFMKGSRNGVITAFFDTGSPDTIISLTDAHKLQIPVKRKPDKHLKGGGEGDIPLIEFKDAKLSTLTDKNQKIDFEMPSIWVNNRNPKMPSILGVDFLLQHKFKLVFDPTNKVGYLEKG